MSTKPKRIPEIPRALVEYLQRVFPDRLPDEPLTPEATAVLVGNQKVIRHLKVHLDQRSQSVLASSNP